MCFLPHLYKSLLVLFLKASLVGQIIFIITLSTYLKFRLGALISKESVLYGVTKISSLGWCQEDTQVFDVCAMSHKVEGDGGEVGDGRMMA